MQLDTTPCGTIDIEVVTNGPIETNTYFVISQGEALVIDPAWDGEQLAAEFQVRHPDVRLMVALCTHGHADHVGGVAGMRAALGEDFGFWLPADDTAVPAENIAHQRSWGIDTPNPGEPTRMIHEGDTIAVGNAMLQAIAVPGHTPGGMVYFAATERGNIAFVGDTLFPGSHGRTDLAGGDERAILASLAKLARLLPDDTTCLTGHGPATTMAIERATNPFMRHDI